MYILLGTENSLNDSFASNGFTVNVAFTQFTVSFLTQEGERERKREVERYGVSLASPFKTNSGKALHFEN